MARIVSELVGLLIKSELKEVKRNEDIYTFLKKVRSMELGVIPKSLYDIIHKDKKELSGVSGEVIFSNPHSLPYLGIDDLGLNAGNTVFYLVEDNYSVLYVVFTVKINEAGIPQAFFAIDVDLQQTPAWCNYTQAFELLKYAYGKMQLFYAK